MVNAFDPKTVAAQVRARADRLAASAPLLPAGEPQGLDVSEEVEIGLVQWRANRWAAVIPSRFGWANLDDLDDEQCSSVDQERLREWSRSPRARNLVLLGPVGTGKSHAGIAACRPSHESGLDVRFLPIEELLDQLRPGGPPNAIYDLADVDLLIVDEVGAERPTDWTAERFYAVVNRRWLEERPTVFTSNLTPKELGEHIGQRAYSRLSGGAVRVAMIGRDRRKTDG